jgi:hypothetical protein
MGGAGRPHASRAVVAGVAPSMGTTAFGQQSAVEPRTPASSGKAPVDTVTFAAQRERKELEREVNARLSQIAAVEGTARRRALHGQLLRHRDVSTGVAEDVAGARPSHVRHPQRHGEVSVASYIPYVRSRSGTTSASLPPTATLSPPIRLLMADAPTNTVRMGTRLRYSTLRSLSSVIVIVNANSVRELNFAQARIRHRD